ncbi:hypothetical protein Cgig2_031862 [Carnegiea gigantea]|uniref:Plastid lipid-associated protein/fibrillin conserved domain-containing protein n=1 Tax=Carnegiea gigantea TaxID=171969 RepID=A0A9Q1QMH8_9CARY|nr:hypothetical protein Cgig2_031862 [Carnegiea gigantea]
MASSVQSSIPTFCSFRRCYDASSSQSFTPLSTFRQIGRRKLNLRRNSELPIIKNVRVCRAVVQQTVQGPSGIFAGEMERLSAKEALLLALQDAGGFEALVEGNVTDLQRMDVMESITVLERLNPTPRPTTSPYLEGRWDFEWFGSGSPASSAAQFLLERFPSSLARISKMEVSFKDTYAKVTAYLRLLNLLESRLILSSKLSIEAPVRIREEYFEGLLEPPTVIEEAVPKQLRSALGQAVGTIEQLPLPLRNVMSSGIRVPLSGTFQRMFMISYLDGEILIIRDVYGVAEVLTRWDVGPSPVMEPGIDYQS